MPASAPSIDHDARRTRRDGSLPYLELRPCMNATPPRDTPPRIVFEPSRFLRRVAIRPDSSSVQST